MTRRFWLVITIMAIAMVVECKLCEAETAHFAARGGGSGGVVADFIDDDEEMMLDSEASRRVLAGGKRYISYGALKRDSTPCNKRGKSYYNCKGSGRANPYKRGCSKITHCYRYTH